MNDPCTPARTWHQLYLLVGLCCLLLTSMANATSTADTRVSLAPAFLALLLDENQTDNALQVLDANWSDGLVPMVLESLRLNRNSATAIGLLRLLEKHTGQAFGFQLGRWQSWLWNRPEVRHPDYAEFKSPLYRLIDPRFGAYFSPARKTNIRLDEVVWGGVAQDGIPPLRRPNMIEAAQATYLADDNVVFGIAVNGDLRAYPKRILAWHEMFVDTVGGIPVAGVYCTLCGALVLYKTRFQDTIHQLGTSGFLYRSNKLMYDQATQSLWNTLWGRPAIGPLVDQGITLERLSVVTTTWGEWRRRHPDTLVLSLDTGHQRDYAEGVAYHAYFATDELMFDVPVRDTRLANKAEVLALLFPEYPDQALAISADFLVRNPVYHDQIGDRSFVVLTDGSGANRVYESGAETFINWDQLSNATDRHGALWRVGEDALIADDGRRLARLPAHRSFWFGWYAAFAHTRLVK